MCRGSGINANRLEEEAGKEGRSKEEGWWVYLGGDGAEMDRPDLRRSAINVYLYSLAGRWEGMIVLAPVCC